MKQRLQRILLLCLFFFVGTTSFAYDCEINGIYYNLNKDDQTASVSYYADSWADFNVDIYYTGNIVIPQSITFEGIEYEVTAIGWSAFAACPDLTSVTIPESVNDIRHYAFWGCTGLTSLTIPNSVTNIGNYAFRGSGLTSIHIPNSISSIGVGIFSECDNLEVVTSEYTEHRDFRYDSRENCNALIYSYTLRSGSNHSGWTNYDEAILVAGCKNTKIPGSVTQIGSSAFEGCRALSAIEIPNGVVSINPNAFWGCSGLTTLEIPNSVTKIGEGAFRGCSGLTVAVIGNGVRTIESSVFADCSCLVICDNETPAAADYFSFSKNMIAMVPVSAVDAYKKATGWKDMQFNSPFTLLGTTQTTITLLAKGSAVADVYAEVDGKKYTSENDTIKITGLAPNKMYTISASWKYGSIDYKQTITALTLNVNLSISLVASTNVTQTLRGTYDAGDAIVVESGFENYAKSDEIKVEGLEPDRYYYYTYYIITSDGSKYVTSSGYATKPINVYINTKTGASHCEITGSWSSIDATIVDYGLTVASKDYPNQKTMKLYGLDPQQNYTVSFYVVTNTGGWYSKTATFTTQALSFVTSTPKVVSLGTAIVAAQSNLDDEETNVGFEWRRTDWTDDFVSNTGGAYLYNGTMEGYIRNLNTEKLWKFRPYYLSNSGTYYYGDWMGLDPTNTSYFEPTVHTYASVNIEGNTALVKGYALTGTDKVTVQGFKYWKSTAGARGMNGIAAIPSDVMTVEASGQVMTASLTGLEYNTTYHYVAFVTTSEGDTFYGEEQVFSTEENPTGIESVYSENYGQEPPTVVARYNMKGERIDTPQEGVNILRMSDGTTRKVWVKKP